MARCTRSAATEQALLQFAPPPHGAVATSDGLGEEFDESDIWGSFSPAPAEPRVVVLPVPAAQKAKETVVAGRAAAHGSLPMSIPDWSKILGNAYRGPQVGDWELDDADDEVVPPHELVWRHRAASLSVHGAAGGVGRSLKVRDAVWMQTTGFRD
jgi:hypothetical protein